MKSSGERASSSDGISSEWGSTTSCRSSRLSSCSSRATISSVRRQPLRRRRRLHGPGRRGHPLTTVPAPIIKQDAGTSKTPTAGSRRVQITDARCLVRIGPRRGWRQDGETDSGRLVEQPQKGTADGAKGKPCAARQGISRARTSCGAELEQQLTLFGHVGAGHKSRSSQEIPERTQPPLRLRRAGRMRRSCRPRYPRNAGIRSTPNSSAKGRHPLGIPVRQQGACRASSPTRVVRPLGQRRDGERQ